MRFLVILFGISALVVINSVSAREGKWVGEVTAITGYYQYNAVEVKDRLPDSFTMNLDSDDLIDQDDDLINYSLSVGYHVSPELLIKGTLVAGLDLDPFFQDFCIILCANDDIRFELDMFLYELDAEYTVYRFNEKVHLFVGGGFVIADLDGGTYRRDDQQRIHTSRVDQTETGFKGVIGLNWDFTNSFTLTLGHQRHSLFDMSKTYLSMRYYF